jgi:hypothetical protein
MEKTRFKGPRLEKRPGMKGLKEKKKGPGICKEDREHQEHVKNM